MRMTILSVGYPLAKVSSSTAGGAEQFLLTLDKAFVRAGHKSIVLAPEGSRCSGLLAPVCLPAGILDAEMKRESRRLFRKELQKVLARHTVDVVHMHGLDFGEYTPENDIPVVVTLHLPLGWYRQDFLKPRRTTQLVCVSRAQARTAPPNGSVPCVIANGIDLDLFNPAPRKGSYVLVMGRICPEKGIHLAIDAASRAGKQLIIAGALFPYPEHQQYFEQMIRPRLDENTRFIGPVGGEWKRSLLAGAQCLLVPSLAPETSSLVAMEALASGTPVIAMRRGALLELVSDNETGFLVNSAEEMASAIVRIGKIHPETCRRQAERRFSSESMIAKYLDLYRLIMTHSHQQEFQAA